ncbi:guanylate kinase [Chromatium okenii]|uniref:guanylate kinase n=1 Tax=Chromatium okenii TaxID=61644 RepID=UPI0026EBF62D|nr:guanylate kinase [Chromatium okenii]MBV5309463.1 guanylate kinase [Chromatium okenii]
MNDGLLFIISAPSGAGKTSLIKALISRDASLSLSISCTTRTQREGEIDGVHYHFLDQTGFAQAVTAGAFLEHAEVFGNHYGTREADVRACLAAGRELILEIDWQGAQQVRARFPAAISIFVAPPSIAELERRLNGRGTDNADVIARRMAQAHSDLTHYTEYDYVVINDDFDAALNALAAIISAERLRLVRQQFHLTELFSHLN